MMANKWVQAVLIGGIGFGIIIGAFAAIFFRPVVMLIIGWVIMTVSLWKTANCRGTDGWGGPYHE